MSPTGQGASLAAAWPRRTALAAAVLTALAASLFSAVLVPTWAATHTLQGQPALISSEDSRQHVSTNQLHSDVAPTGNVVAAAAAPGHAIAHDVAIASSSSHEALSAGKAHQHQHGGHDVLVYADVEQALDTASTANGASVELSGDGRQLLQDDNNDGIEQRGGDPALARAAQSTGMGGIGPGKRKRKLKRAGGSGGSAPGGAAGGGVGPTVAGWLGLSGDTTAVSGGTRPRMQRPLARQGGGNDPSPDDGGSPFRRKKKKKGGKKKRAAAIAMGYDEKDEDDSGVSGRLDIY